MTGGRWTRVSWGLAQRLFSLRSPRVRATRATARWWRKRESAHGESDGVAKWSPTSTAQRRPEREESVASLGDYRSAMKAAIWQTDQPLLADQGHEISQPLTASVRCSRKSTPMGRLTTVRRDRASLSGPRCSRFQYQTDPSIPAHRRKCGLADCWESSACKFR